MFAGGYPGDGRWRKVSRVAARGRAPTRAFAGRRGRRPLRVAREWAAAGACPSSGPAGPPSPKGEGKSCSGGIHPSRGVGSNGRSRRGGGTPPYGWGYGNAVGFTRAAVPGPPHGRGRACPVRGMAVGGRFRGASGTPPPTVCPGTGGSGSLPLIRPCGATFPRGGRQGLLLAATEGRGWLGAPRPTDGDTETPAWFTRTPVPGPPHGRGRACPARELA